MKINILSIILLLVCFGLSYQISMAQTSDHEKVEAMIYTLFENMAKHDTTALRAMFTPDAQLVSVYTIRQGDEVRTDDTIDKFVNSIGSAMNVKLDERIWGVTVRIDGNLAQVWNSYAFYANDEFSHCGVDAFLLHKKEGEWKIFHIADTRTRQNCDIPEEIKNK